MLIEQGVQIVHTALVCEKSTLQIKLMALVCDFSTIQIVLNTAVLKHACHNTAGAEGYSLDYVQVGCSSGDGA